MVRSQSEFRYGSNITSSETEQVGKLSLKGEGTGWSLLFGRNPHPVAHAVFSDWTSSLIHWASLAAPELGAPSATVSLPEGMTLRNSSSRAGAGGRESMRRGIWCWKG